MARLASSTIKIKINTTTVAESTPVYISFENSSGQIVNTNLNGLTVQDLVLGYCIPGNIVSIGSTRLLVYFEGCPTPESITIDPGLVLSTPTPTPTPTLTPTPTPTSQAVTNTPTPTPTSEISYNYYIVRGCPNSFYEGQDRVVKINDTVLYDSGPNINQGGLYQYGTHIVSIFGNTWYFSSDATIEDWEDDTGRFPVASYFINDPNSVTQNTCG